MNGWLNINNKQSEWTKKKRELHNEYKVYMKKMNRVHVIQLVVVLIN